VAVPFAISESIEDGHVAIALTGEVDLATVGAIRDRVDAHLKSTEISGFVVDLEAVTFLDSSGIGVLIGCRRQALEAGRSFRVIHIVGRAKEVLDMTGVTALLTDG
jgi:anti-sigma B factor antagonist